VRLETDWDLSRTPPPSFNPFEDYSQAGPIYITFYYVQEKHEDYPIHFKLSEYSLVRRQFATWVTDVWSEIIENERLTANISHIFWRANITDPAHNPAHTKFWVFIVDVQRLTLVLRAHIGRNLAIHPVLLEIITQFALPNYAFIDVLRKGG
jgi:hypothetical protein